MLSSITPLGERGRASRWSVTAGAYLVGSLAGGTVLGALLGLLGALLPAGATAGSVLLGLVVVAAGLSLAVETGRLPQPPTWRRQVDEHWLRRYRGWVYGVGYGAQLGVGVVTIVTSPVLYLALLLMLATRDVAAATALGAGFGLVRALPVLMLRRVDRPERLTRLHRQLQRRAGTARTVTAATCAGTAAMGALVLGTVLV
ncbi:hypothetical protein ACFFKU_15785 [Kineococcus gynurae]|uniref:Urease accessory protein UreH-like transmembrane domain-containing protein n=1 Tax=Kineococcus gynurae TaxID=452979 RepID=A0ABV5LXB6_9ACTN